MREFHFRKMIEEEISIYINNIARELEEKHDKWFEGFGFPIFGVTSKDYHEQVYFESYLESYTRKMINGILREMCRFELADIIDWPESDGEEIYIGYTNAECEEKFGFEFINRDRKIGYRYVFNKDQIEKLLSKEEVEAIRVVLWQEAEKPISNIYEGAQVSFINIWELFVELFEDMDEKEVRMNYAIFVEEVTKAVEQANSMISLITMPGFTPSYIHIFRSEVFVSSQVK